MHVQQTFTSQARVAAARTKRAGGAPRSLVVAGAVLLFSLLATTTEAAPQAELWPRWEAHNPESTQSIDHTDWGTFLDAYLVTGHPSGVNRVRYAEVTSADREDLQRYIRRMEEVTVSDLNRDEQMAYWTNLYNAVTIDLILEHYPVDSIRDIGISGSVFNRHPWDAHLVTIEGEEVTLNDIEHRIMRPIWQDPRIHYAVNCASIGCPNLQPEPFTAETWDAMYDAAAREFINHRRAVDLTGRRPLFSSIYDWYQDDFDGSLEGVVTHALPYAEGALRTQLRDYADGGYRGRVRYEYDWALNRP